MPAADVRKIAHAEIARAQESTPPGEKPFLDADAIARVTDEAGFDLDAGERAAMLWLGGAVRTSPEGVWRLTAAFARPSAEVWTATKAALAHKRAKPTLHAVVYGASWCGPCRDAKTLLRKLGLKVTYVDIEGSPAARTAYERQCAQQGLETRIPVIGVGKTWVLGFEADRLLAVVKAEAQRGAEARENAQRRATPTK